ncbi:MAG: STAS domain-containing protein [candidate division KSB1 bacterium]|nr:STAS domain-containing protein [candidate division KSB1 bacterium]MDZ7294926.1 STAS domain-containing protein [candidate division KSB1 bacterium]MDZ7337570.1 STAS domain-containing protein [candidate division KSB1 bacterium]MDZ7377812.1 STAS domain-containing protein [candidate division KSB1 bacterium]MDZ7385561.1 STAS domain-containing protein [candidate division KSB1 bacterium]
MEGIQLSVERPISRDDIAIIKVGGYIDTTTSSELEHSLTSLLKAGSYNIIIDLANVDYISSAGWGIFISEIKGIREKGGDLKLVGMIPDVYEVFELLEFHYILKAFDTVEEAIRDFDAEAKTKGRVVVQAGEESVGSAWSPAASAAEATAERGPIEDDIAEKIKRVVAEFPDAGTAKILKELNTPRFGNVKLGWFQIRKYLKQLDLDSKKKRQDFARQSS